MKLHAGLLLILEFFASSPNEQMAYLTRDNSFSDAKDELDELIDDFFEELVPIMDAENEWRSQFPSVSKLYDKFPGKWWEDASVSSIEALKTGAFWEGVRVIATSALKER